MTSIQALLPIERTRLILIWTMYLSREINISVKDEVSTWRKQLKIVDEDQLLVVFAWCNDDELRAARMFPEYGL